MQKYTRRTALTALCALLLTACPSSTQPGGGQPTVTRQKPQAVVAIALGGGASKGFAHIGILKVLKQHNIPVKVVTGTSAGVIVGSMYASGMSPDRMELEAEILGKTDLVDLTLSTSGFIKGEKLQNYINHKVGNPPSSSSRLNSPPSPPTSPPAKPSPSTGATPDKPSAPPPPSPTSSSPSSSPAAATWTAA